MRKFYLFFIAALFIFVFNIHAATQTINTVPSANSTFITNLQTFLENENADRAQDILRKVISGGIGATAASLTHTISAVYAYVDGYYVYDAAVSHTYTASKDTFVFLRYNDATTFTISGASITYDGNFCFAEMANSSDIPVVGAGGMLLFEAVTNGTTITTVNDYRSGGIVFLSDPAFSDGSSGKLADAVATLGSLPVTLIIDTKDNVLANTSVASTMTLSFVSNISLNIASGITLTFAANSTIDAGNWTIFNGAGASGVTIPVNQVINPYWFGMSPSASAANNSTYFDYVMDAVTSGGYIRLEPGSYNVDGNLTVDVGCVIDGQERKAELSWASDTSANRGLLVTASNTKITGLELDGPQYASEVATQIGISAYGASEATSISNITVEDCYIHDWGFEAVKMKWVDNGIVKDNLIDDILYVGVAYNSVEGGKIDNNTIQTVSATTGAGITLTRDEEDSITLYPRTSGIMVSNNIVNGALGDSYDTHCGENIIFSNNIGLNGNHCYDIVACDNSVDDSQIWAPLNVTINGGVCDSGVTDGSKGFGISFSGASGDTEYATGNISDVHVIGYGAEDSSTSSCITLKWTQGVSISGVDLHDCGANGYYVNTYNDNLSINGGTIIDPWSDTNADVYGIFVDNTYNKVFIDGVTFGVDDNAGTYVLTRDLRIDDAAGTEVKLGKNGWYADTSISDPGFKTYRGDTTAVAYSEASTGDLITRTPPVDWFGSGQQYRIVAAGTKTGGNGNKTVTCYFGSTGVVVNAAANDTNDWGWEADIWIYGTANQKMWWRGTNGATTLSGYEAMTEDTTSTVNVKCTATLAHADDTVTQTLLMIQPVD